MNYKFEDISKLDWTDHRTWGNKASYLADAKRVGLPVMDGFCISIQGIGIDWTEDQFEKDLAVHFKHLKERTGARYYIARSSAQFEDQANHIFPGIYQSKGYISNLEELLCAIRLCCGSFSSKAAEVYKRDLKLTDMDQEYFCILVQEQLKPEYSGVVFTTNPIPEYGGENSYYVELVQGHCCDMLQGRIGANTYILAKVEDTFQVKRISNLKEIDETQIKPILIQLGTLAGHAVKLYGASVDIEWGYSQGMLAIFQIRPVPILKRTPFMEAGLSRTLGLKAEAMEWFHAVGLFPKELLIIGAGERLNELEHKIEEAEYLSGPITVRYSYDCELGLPRYFATDKKDAFQFIKDTYQAEWSIILHQSISVAHSYELCLSKDKCILEHVPGMWESDNKIAADLWIFEQNQVTSFAVNSIRNAKYENFTGISYVAVEPYGKAEIKQIALSILPYIQILRRGWSINIGTNFHFVQDETGRFFFLNHRELSSSPEWNSTRGNLTIIKSTKDFASWKGGDVLLEINLKRGEEQLLAEYVPFLKKMRNRVYVKFGILSHPAILLREMGIHVYPEYTLHKKYVFNLDVKM